MTCITDDDGYKNFQCDTCPEIFETKRRDFLEAKIFFERFGWRSYKGPDKMFAHACPPCTANFVADQQAKAARK